MTTRLVVEDLHHHFGRHEVLRGVEISLAAGELVGLLGPNGAGKSTLLRCITATLAVQRGRILIDGTDIAIDRMAAGRKLGVAVDPEHLPGLLNARQCMQLVADVRGADPSLVEALQLSEALGMSPWIDRAVHELSLGTRQKLAIVLALIGSPALIVLDEVLNGLDPLAAYALKQTLRARTDDGACVILATHGLEVAERFLARALLLLDGRIAADWDSSALTALRASSAGGLEHAVVEKLRAARVGG